MTKKIGIKDRRLLIAKNSIMMLVVLVIIFLAVFAWYHTQKDVTASNIAITAAPTEIVEVAFPKDDGSYPAENETDDQDNPLWKKTINFTDGILNPLLYKDVTGDGESLIIPAFEVENNVKSVITTGGWTDALASKDDNSVEKNEYNYIAVDFYVRSTSNNIALQADSYLAGECEMSGKSLTTAPNPRSSFGNFSPDAIVGAMRVALVGGLVEEGASAPDNPTRKMTWLPRPDIYLNTTEHDDDWTVTTGITSSNDLWATTSVHNYYEVDYENLLVKPAVLSEKFWVSNPSRTQTFTVDENSVSIPTLGAQVPIAGDTVTVESVETLPDPVTMGSTDYYIYKYTLNIWIEGTDTEARKAMDEGAFKLNLKIG